MIATKHLTEAQRILQEHCYNCRNKGPGCAVCHISQAIKEINSAQAARQAEPPKAKEPDEGEQCLFMGELAMEIQAPVDGDIRDTMICESYRAPLSKEEHNAL